MLAVFTVTNTEDAGPGSLRQAILDANAAPAPDEVRFDLPGSGIRTIAPRSPLPDVTDPLSVNGSTQPGYSGSPLVELDGADAGAADGLRFRAHSLVLGLAVVRFSGHGLAFVEGGGRIESSWVGVTRPAGAADTVGRGNGGAGVFVAASGVVIGDAGIGRGNIISGNVGPGVWVSGVGTVGTGGPTVLRGNRIGVSANGNRQSNFQEGVLVEGSPDTRVGGGTRAQGNVISGNYASGVRIAADSPGTLVQGNVIGPAPGGMDPLSTNTVTPPRPHKDGVTTSADRVTIGGHGEARNIVSANPGSGIAVLGGSNVALDNNYIGTDAAGGRGIGRQRYGVSIDGASFVRLGSGFQGRNVISGNAGSGVVVAALSGPDGMGRVYFVSNYVGTSADGARAVGNGWDEDEALRDGVTVSAMGDGSVRIGDNARNVISANGGAGVAVTGNVPTWIEQNHIGTNAAGTAPLGNAAEGVLLAGGAAVVGANVISGNGRSGVRVAPRIAGGSGGARDALVGGNYVGTTADGRSALPNAVHGIEVLDGTEVRIGSLASTSRDFFSGNVISGNQGHGVVVAGGSSVSLAANRIGVDLTGTAAVGNGGSGVFIAASNVTVGGVRHQDAQSRSGNVISANGGNGVTLADYLGTPTSGNRLYDNAIGTNATRSADVTGLGNRGHGVAVINSSRNFIGGSVGDTWEYGNTISFNGGSGVVVQRLPSLAVPLPPGVPLAEQNAIAGNTMLANALTPIDLGGDGSTPNDPLDADTGPNGLQNHPEVRWASHTLGFGSTVSYSLQSRPGRTYRLEFFVRGTPAGSTQVTTDAAGYANGEFVMRDAPAIPAEGTVTATATDTLTGDTSEMSPPVPRHASLIVGRHFFYNNSVYDGFDPAANSADDAAIAPDKRPPFAIDSTFQGFAPAAFTSYDKGINGVMLDVAGLPQGAALTAANFPVTMERTVVRNGRASQVVGPGPAPTSVTVRRGAGVGGSDRVTLIWHDGAIRNAWLAVAYVAPPGSPPVPGPLGVIFGNLAGDRAERTDRARYRDLLYYRVDALDLAAVKGMLGQRVGISSRYDHNRDGVINALDVAVVKGNLTRLLRSTYPVGRL